MEFAFTEEQAMIAETAHGFFRKNATSERTRSAMEGDGLDRELWLDFCQELGLSGIAVPEAMGGAGLGFVELASVAEAAGAQVAAVPLLGHAMAVRALVAGGTDSLRERWLAPLLSGDACAAFATCDRLEDRNGVLSGVADFVAHGGIADVFLVASGEGMWLVEGAREGVGIIKHVSMDQTRPFATLALAGVRAEPLSGMAIGAAHEAGWLCLAAEALGLAQEALDRTVAYAKERVQFGRAIGSFQAYKHRLADLMVEIEQARSAVYWAACTIDEGGHDARIALHSAKAFCADTAFLVAANMVQLHGGIGFTWEHDAHLYFKRARAILSMLGNSDWHREQVAQAILGEVA